MLEFRRNISRGLWDRSPISIERLGMELESGLDQDTCFIVEVDSGRKVENIMSFGGAGKQYFATSGSALGWALGASFGVSLAKPDRPVVALIGDGAFLYSGPQPLWSMARYHAPGTVIVMNNRSYNRERTGMFDNGGRQFETGLDMTCYLGDPDIDYAKMASAFGVEGEIVAEPSSLQPALERAKRINIEGRPYLLDVHIERDGFGAASTWHPPHSIAALRQKSG